MCSERIKAEIKWNQGRNVIRHVGGDCKTQLCDIGTVVRRDGSKPHEIYMNEVGVYSLNRPCNVQPEAGVYGLI